MWNATQLRIAGILIGFAIPTGFPVKTSDVLLQPWCPTRHHTSRIESEINGSNNNIQPSSPSLNNLASGIGNIDSDLVNRESKLHKVALHGPYLGEGMEAYREKDVKSIVGRAKADLLTLLKTTGLDPIKAYAEHFFPSVNLDQITDPNRVRPGLVTPGSAERTFENVHRFLTHLKRVVETDLVIDLHVYTSPDHARIKIASLGGGEPRVATSNCKLTNIYRGYYQYIVTKKGFKDIHDHLNLVDEEGTVFECWLVKESDKDDPQPCNLRKF